MTTDITNSDDVIDSRDVIARIEELEAERDSFEDGDWAEASPDEAAELASLQALAKDGENYADDWQYGATLVRDSYFEQYAEELAADIGAIDPKASWPLNCIDWEAAADQLKIDYTAIDFDGVTYWVR
jgi:hypothetical protein